MIVSPTFPKSSSVSHVARRIPDGNGWVITACGQAFHESQLAAAPVQDRPMCKHCGRVGWPA